MARLLEPVLSARQRLHDTPKQSSVLVRNEVCRSLERNYAELAAAAPIAVRDASREGFAALARGLVEAAGAPPTRAAVGPALPIG